MQSRKYGIIKEIARHFVPLSSRKAGILLAINQPALRGSTPRQNHNWRNRGATSTAPPVARCHVEVTAWGVLVAGTWVRSTQTHAGSILKIYSVISVPILKNHNQS